jgi:hypothetical protein
MPLRTTPKRHNAASLSAAQPAHLLIGVVVQMVAEDKISIFPVSVTTRAASQLA